MNEAAFPRRPDHERIALVLQGGGALGAYQVGVYQALEEHGFAPDWIAGTSIGSINGAIIAGNPAGERLSQLEGFWRAVSHADFWDVARMPDDLRQLYSGWSALGTTLAGRPGFFTPRLSHPLAVLATDSAETASYYDTTALRALLERVIDFELLNRGPIRFSLGAVHITTGKLRYFDSRYQRIGPEHVMASSALPPAFPAVRVDGELYWDGGIYSNTPLEIVLDDFPRVDTLCFMIALFNPAGPEPRSLPEVWTRRKDIMYGTRARQHIAAYCRIHNLRRAIQVLYERLPAAIRNEPEIAALAELGCHTTMEIVRLMYAPRDWELATKGMDFSWAAIEERWTQGYRDATRVLKRAAWLEPVPPHVGVVVHDLPPEEVRVGGRIETPARHHPNPVKEEDRPVTIDNPLKNELAS